MDIQVINEPLIQSLKLNQSSNSCFKLPLKLEFYLFIYFIFSLYVLIMV